MQHSFGGNPKDKKPNNKTLKQFTETKKGFAETKKGFPESSFHFLNTKIQKTLLTFSFYFLAFN